MPLQEYDNLLATLHLSTTVIAPHISRKPLFVPKVPANRREFGGWVLSCDLIVPWRQRCGKCSIRCVPQYVHKKPELHFTPLYQLFLPVVQVKLTYFCFSFAPSIKVFEAHLLALALYLSVLDVKGSRCAVWSPCRAAAYVSLFQSTNIRTGTQ